MTALAAERDTPRKGLGTTAVIPLITVKLKAAAKVYKGGIVCVDATGYGVPGATATGLRVIGIATASVDNTSGASGDLSVDVMRGQFPFVNKSDDLVVQADFSSAVYLVDDQTVGHGSATATRSIAGTFWGFDEAGLPLVELGIRSATGV